MFYNQYQTKIHTMQYRKILILVSLIFLLSACASIDRQFVDYPEFISADNWDGESSALIVGRAPVSMLYGAKGSAVVLTHDSTQKRYRSIHKGKPDKFLPESITRYLSTSEEEYFAFAVPAGSYQLDSVAAWIGQVSGYFGVGEPVLRVSLEPGSINYIGTLLNEFNAPQHPNDYGEIIAVTNIYNWDCSLTAYVCGYSPSERKLGKTTTRLFVIDEGDNFIDAISVKFPQLEGKIIVWNLLNN